MKCRWNLWAPQWYNTSHQYIVDKPLLGVFKTILKEKVKDGISRHTINLSYFHFFGVLYFLALSYTLHSIFPSL